ncbi:MAG: hypothetical protein HYR64_06340 [Fimbriimonas ginsengisoli]|uniref:Porin n=1 Tax=Fimbriimonas ginsengisoli TaxID=1005039 RepID=A0A931LSL0_FIMGI|nr:hypothetical protein [Fimbriimonas ginsengisoli]
MGKVRFKVAASWAAAAFLSLPALAVPLDAPRQDGQQDNTKLLQELAREVAALRDTVRRQQAEIDELKHAKQSGGLSPEQAKRLDALERVKLSGFEQFQFRRSDQSGKEESAFYSKRTRIVIEAKLETNMAMKASFDIAGGKDTNGSITKDAYLAYTGTGGGWAATAGQIALPLGYDLQRGDIDRELPERALYNRTLFAGERGRGVNLRAMASGVTLQAGLWNALTSEDPEQLTFAPGGHGRLVGTGGIKLNKKDVEVGLSGLIGRRPSFAGTAAVSPETDRKLAYGHAILKNVAGGRLHVLAEGLVGQDRVPSTAGSVSAVSKNMHGYQITIGGKVGQSGSLDFRNEQFTSDLNSANKTATAHGLSYQHALSPRAKLMLAREWWNDSSAASSKYTITTLRVTFSM